MLTFAEFTEDYKTAKDIKKTLDDHGYSKYRKSSKSAMGGKDHYYHKDTHDAKNVLSVNMKSGKHPTIGGTRLPNKGAKRPTETWGWSGAKGVSQFKKHLKHF